MLTKTLIAMVGRAKSGKDTAYEIIKQKHPKFERLSFADELKQMVATTLGVTVDDIAKDKEKYRHYLIFTGKIFREYDKEFWINKLLFEDEVTYKNLPDNIVITDCRYENEIRALEQFCYLNGYNLVIVAIRVSKGNLLARGYNEEIYYHVSEVLIDLIWQKHKCIIIENNDGVEDFKKIILRVLNSHVQ